LAERFHLPYNLVISNVPGPRQPLYFAGARMRFQFPLSIVTDGMGLNVTVQSYLDHIDIGIVADRELVPDVDVLADLHLAELAVLAEATGVEPAETPDLGADESAKKRAPKRKPAKRKAAAKRKAKKPAARKRAAKKRAAKKPATTKRAAKKPAAER
jgi:diacylglycerol O-acyltransferase / wax synthase